MNNRKFEGMDTKITAKRFAREYAGQYFMCGDKKVRIVGYRRRSAKVMELIVSGIGGWELKYVENAPNHVFTARVQAKRVYYVQLKDLAL